MSQAIKYNDLIYDVGMHKGEDTDFYLKKGFRVIGFEANPDLVSHNQNRFREEIHDNRLVIISGAIADVSPKAKKIIFYVNDRQSVWGTIDPEWVSRNETRGTKHREIEVDSVNFTECLERFGIPYYMKIDIEGADIICLKCLSNFDNKPSYISVESEKIDFKKLENEINLLESLGYDSFMAVQQAHIHKVKVTVPAKEGTFVSYTFVEGASGLFGKELPGKYKTKTEILEDYNKIFKDYKRYGDNTFWYKIKIIKLALLFIAKIINKPIPGWYDTHARHSSEKP